MESRTSNVLTLTRDDMSQSQLSVVKISSETNFFLRPAKADTDDQAEFYKEVNRNLIKQVQAVNPREIWLEFFGEFEGPKTSMLINQRDELLTHAALKKIMKEKYEKFHLIRAASSDEEKKRVERYIEDDLSLLIQSFDQTAVSFFQQALGPQTSSDGGATTMVANVERLQSKQVVKFCMEGVKIETTETYKLPDGKTCVCSAVIAPARYTDKDDTQFHNQNPSNSSSGHLPKMLRFQSFKVPNELVGYFRIHKNMEVAKRWRNLAVGFGIVAVIFFSVGNLIPPVGWILGSFAAAVSGLCAKRAVTAKHEITAYNIKMEGDPVEARRVDEIQGEHIDFNQDSSLALEQQPKTQVLSTVAVVTRLSKSSRGSTSSSNSEEQETSPLLSEDREAKKIEAELHIAQGQFSTAPQHRGSSPLAEAVTEEGIFAEDLADDLADEPLNRVVAGARRRTRTGSRGGA